MLKSQSLLGYTNSFSNDYEKNDKIIFLMTKKMKKLYIALFAVTTEYLKNLKGHKNICSLYYLQ